MSKIKHEQKDGVQSDSVLPSATEAQETIRDILATLVPPESIEITDIFGVAHKLRSTTSARSQIKIMRMLENIKDVSIDGLEIGNITPKELISLLGSLITNEAVFETICKAVEYAHPRLVDNLKEAALNQNVEYDPQLPIADLLPIEEAIASIVPLLLSIARRTGQAINKIAEAAAK